MVTSLAIDSFLNHPGTLFDVRSPGEFTQGRIPGALSLPLFSDDERALVGTTYKQQGKDAAVLLGLQLTGPKLASFVETAKAVANSKDVRIHCWRGGMRSGAMAWLLELAGFSPVVLQGGYKSFRQWCGTQFEKPRQLIVVGGMTGSGKTEVLRELQGLGEQVLDLEALANHRGSAYGRIGYDSPQPSTEHFENEMAIQLSSFDVERPVWVEDESRLIGTCHIPHPFFSAMRTAKFFIVEMSREERLARLCSEYGKGSREDLIVATKRIAKHLGGVRTARAIEAITLGDIPTAAAIILDYYDASYAHAANRRSELLDL